jgi:hypothetical protein
LAFASVLASLGFPFCRIGVSGGEKSVSGVVLASILPAGEAFGSMTCPRSTLPADASAVILILSSVSFIARGMNEWRVGYYADSNPRTCVLMTVAWGRGNTQHSYCGTSHFKLKHWKIRKQGGVYGL